MKKRIVSLALALMMCLSLSVTALAVDSATTTIPTEITSYLMDENGNQIPVEGKLVSLSTPMDRSINNTIAATYEYTVYSDGIGFYSDRSSTASDVDSNGLVRAYVTVTYQQEGVGFPYQYLLTSVESHWILYNTNTTVTSARMHYICYDAGDADDQEWYGTISNNFFTYTDFDTFTHTGFASVGATLTLTLRANTSAPTWQLVVSNSVYTS